MKNLPGKVIDVLEKNEWRVCGIYEQDDKQYAELETFSDAGEDVLVTIWYDGTGRDFANSFYEYYAGFDPDEHAEALVAMRGQHGIPDSIRTLIDDADSINDMLEKTACELTGLYQ